MSRPALPYPRFVLLCEALQRLYVAREFRRMAKAKRLAPTDRAGFHALGLHPHSGAEIDAREVELRGVLADIPARFAPSNPVMRFSFERYQELKAGTHV